MGGVSALNGSIFPGSPDDAGGSPGCESTWVCPAEVGELGDKGGKLGAQGD